MNLPLNQRRKKKMKKPGHQHARKVGGIWLDPMSFPTLTEQ
jgi:hypothetical protein